MSVKSKSLTVEQQEVVRSKANLLVVKAFAGAGKTSTLVEYAEARPNSRGLYLAFNRSVADEAKQRFPESVDSRTSHSMAFSAVGHKYKKKLGNVQPYQVNQAFQCGNRRAKEALSIVNAFLYSADVEISETHIDPAEVPSPEERLVLLRLAKKIWGSMQDLDSEIKMTHDGYLKIWALQRPKLRYDYILLDEGQDTNALLLQLVMDQRKHSTIVLVGDEHQGIYGFRKAMNAMVAVEAEQCLALTQSFRFGQGIADVATKLLQTFKGETHTVRGRSDITVQWRVDYRKHHALIGRTNAGLFQAIARAVLGNQSPQIYFVGGFDSYLFGKVLDAYHLWSGDQHLIKDANISRFKSWIDFSEYGDEAGDAEVKALVKTVEAFSTDVPKIYDRIRAAETTREDRASVTLTTGHRAKGLEWDQVHLCDDFVEFPPDEDVNEEEINLLYVGVTRAIRSIRLPSSLQQWLQSQGFDFDAPEEDEHERISDPVEAPVDITAEELRLQRDQLLEAICDVARRAGALGQSDPVISVSQAIELCSGIAKRFDELPA